MTVIFLISKISLQLFLCDEQSIDIPTEFYLSQNYPNPFNPTTKIRYSVPAEGKSEMSNVGSRHASTVQLKVYDILGNEIAALVNKEQQPGIYELVFDAERYHLPSGIYFYKLQINGFAETKKMILLR